MHIEPGVQNQLRRVGFMCQGLCKRDMPEGPHGGLSPHLRMSGRAALQRGLPAVESVGVIVPICGFRSYLGLILTPLSYEIFT